MTHSEAGKLGAIKAESFRKKQKEQAIARYRQNPKFCLFCGIPITVKDEYANRAFSKIKYKKFCNQSCGAKYNNKRPRPCVIKPIRLCFCGTPIKPWAKAYCSRKCFQTTIEIKDVDILNSHTEVKSKHLRTVMLRNGVPYLCTLCGIDSTWNQQALVLQVDHKDGNCRNNKFENLRFLCPNCHSQTPTYGSRNMGNGRMSRRKKKMEPGVGIEPTMSVSATRVLQTRP